MPDNIPRGVRNGNPGNLEWGAPWQGLKQRVAGRTDPRFAEFETPVYGIRALAVTLITYQDKYDIRTPDEIINRWAPAVENNTAAYANAVARAAGVTPDTQLDLHNPDQLRAVVEAIIRHENGLGPLKTPNTWYGADVIDKALAAAGILKRAKTVAKVPATRESMAGAAVPGTVGLGTLAEQAPAITSAVTSTEDHLTSGNWVRIALGVVLLVAALVVVWSQIKKRRLGVE